MNTKKNNSKKLIVLLLVLMLLIGSVIGGTVAFLMTKTDPVTNTFVAGNIGALTLKESDTAVKTTDGKNTYVIIPGKNITKDPKVSYTPADANDLGEVYIFVAVTGGSWNYDEQTQKFIADGLSWSVAEGWTHLSGNVFYMTTSAAVDDKAFIAGNTISVATTITKGAAMNAAAAAADGLTFTAYAIQKEGFTADTEPAAAKLAWAQAQSATPN